MTTRLDAYSRAVFLLALFLNAVAFNRNWFDLFGLPKLLSYWILAAVSIALYALSSRRKSLRMPWPRIAVPILAFITACGISAILSDAGRISLLGISGRYGGVIPLLVYTSAVVITIALYWDRPERTQNIAMAIWLGVVVMAVYSLVQQAGFDPYGWHSADGIPPQYPASTMGNSNFAGAFLAIGLPLGVCLLAVSRPRRRCLLLLGLGIELLGLWYAQSRGAFLAALVGLGTVAWICRDRAPRPARLLAFGAVAVVAASALAMGWQSLSRERPDRPNLLDASSAEGRLEYWRVAGRVFLDNPLVGTGPETFYATYPLYRQMKVAADGRNPGLTDKPHNIFLEYAANGGLIGVGTYVWVVATAMWYGIRRSRAVTRHQRFLLAAFIGMLAAYLTQASVSIDVPGLALLGWLAIGAIATLADPRVMLKRENAVGGLSEPPELRMRRWWTGPVIRVGIAGGASASVVLALVLLRADVNAGSGRFARASELNPWQGEYAYGEGLAAMAVANAIPDLSKKDVQFALARDDFERALDVWPNYWPNMQGMAEMYTSWGDSVDPSRYRDAIDWWQRTLARDPTNVLLRQAFDVARDRMQRKVSELEASAAESPDSREGWLKAAKGRVALGERELARASLRRVLDMDPNDREALALLATLPA